MSDLEQTLTRHSGESAKAHAAFCDYARMGRGRSLAKLHQAYTEATPAAAPTTSLRWLKEWSRTHDWQARVAAYDDAAEAMRNAEAERLLTQGLAATHNRLAELDELYHALKASFADGEGLWYMDIKLSPRGDAVEVPAFNKALVDSLRGVLDDIAKEVGGRKVQAEVTGAGGTPLLPLEMLVDALRQAEEDRDGRHG